MASEAKSRFAVQFEKTSGDNRMASKDVMKD